IGGLAQVLAQTPADLERFIALGLPPERGQVTGNLKESLVVPAAEVERGRALRATALANRRVWIAGSLREGEVTAIAEAVARVRAAVPDAVAILVPRHPERAEEFATALHTHDIISIRWNSLENPTSLAPGAVVLVDRVGVLLALYAAADVAFVGGTLAPFGGHNLLEPALLGLPVIVGPSLEQVRPAAERLKAAGALAVVRDGASLAAELIALLKDPQAARRQGEAARDAVGDSGALAATLAALRPYL
ncbi:MAG: 3-deoxy-D-manno-octulosonic acid transferase, partial [Gammaproteobacteria bacterium]